MCACFSHRFGIAHGDHLSQRLLRCDLGPATKAAPGNLLEMAILGTPSRPAESQIVGVGSSNLCFVFLLFFVFFNFYLFMAVLGLRFCARAFSSCGKRGPLLIAVRGPLTVAASLLAELRLQTRRPSNCGPRAQPLRGTWDPPRPGPEPASPALAGRLSTTAPPGKPQPVF